MMNNGFTFAWMWYICGKLKSQTVNYSFLEVLLYCLFSALHFIYPRASLNFPSPWLRSDNRRLKINLAKMEMFPFSDVTFSPIFSYSAFQLNKSKPFSWTPFLSISCLIFYTHPCSKIAGYTWLNQMLSVSFSALGGRHFLPADTWIFNFPA